MASRTALAGVIAIASATLSDTRTSIIVGVIVGVVNTVFLVFLNNRTAKQLDAMRTLAEKDREIDRLSRRCDRLVEVLDRSGIRVRTSDRVDVRDAE